MSNDFLPSITIGSVGGSTPLSAFFSDGKIPKVGDRFFLECFKVVDVGGGRSTLQFMLSPLESSGEPKLRDEKSPVIYRYLRPQDYYSGSGDSPHNLGGVTFAFVINHAKGIVSAGAAICDDDWNFNKEEGRRIAYGNLHRAPFEFPYDWRVPLVRGAVDAYFKNKGLRAKNPKLAKALFKLISARIHD